MHSAYQQLFAAFARLRFSFDFRPSFVLASDNVFAAVRRILPAVRLSPAANPLRGVGWCDYTLFAAASHCPKVQFAKSIRNTIEFTVYAAFRHSRPTKSRIRENAASRCFFGCSDRLLQVARILRNPRDDKFFVRNGNCKAGFVRITRF